MLALFMLGMLVSIFCQVTFRYFLHLPLSWTEEASRYMMIYVVYIGASVGLYRGSHLGFSYVLEKVRHKTVVILNLIASAGILTFCCYFTYYGIIIVTRNMYQVTPGLQLPMWCVYAALPISGVLCTLQTINNITRLSAHLNQLRRA